LNIEGLRERAKVPFSYCEPEKPPPLVYWSQFEKKFQSTGHKNQWRL
jgi:hypothetical protein